MFEREYVSCWILYQLQFHYGTVLYPVYTTKTYI